MRYELEVICITPSTGVFRESGKVAVLTYWKKADASHGKRVLSFDYLVICKTGNKTVLFTTIYYLYTWIQKYCTNSTISSVMRHRCL